MIDDRFGVKFADFTSPEYAKYDKITEKKWEACRGLGLSFGYNQVEGPEQVIAPDKLIALLVDIVSKNGNLLLDVGPRANGSISDIQLDRLHKLGAWLSVNGEGIFDSRPWVRATGTAAGTDIRFTHKNNSLYAIFLSRPSGNTLTIPGVRTAGNTRAEILGVAGSPSLKDRNGALLIESRNALPAGTAITVKLTPAPQSTQAA